MRVLLSSKNIQQDKIPEGFEFIKTTENFEAIASIPQNGCEVIICDSATDLLPYEKAKELFNILSSKIRSGGHMQIVGLDLESLCEKTSINEISCEDFNKVIASIHSVFGLTSLVSLLRYCGLDVVQSSKESIGYKVICQNAKK